MSTSYGIFYMVFGVLVFLALPGYVGKYWTLDALSGIMVLGIPLGEYLFAFTFGLVWSSLYEHYTWHLIVSVR